MRTTCRYASSTPASMPRLSRTSAQAIGAVADEAADDTFYAVANYTAFPPLVKELDGLKDDDAARLSPTP